MSSKKMTLVVVLLVLLGAGWLLSFKAVSKTDEIREQETLLMEADSLVERGIYVRAITNYKKALETETKLNPEIQKKLLVAYKEYGDMDAYTALVEQRTKDGTAEEEEYLTAASEYYQGQDIEEAVALLRKGIAATGLASLEEYMETIRYAYEMKASGYQQITPTINNDIMPAYDGEKWGYVSASLGKVLPFIYDSATPFGSQGYAVVSQNGTYYAILKNGDRYGADDGSSYPQMTDVLMVSGSRILGKRDGKYSYFNYDFAPFNADFQFDAVTGNACGVAAVCKDDKWGIIKDSGEMVTDYIYEEVAVNSLGCAFAGDRAMVCENGKWCMIDVEGNRVGDEGYANAKAPESEGFVAVCNEQGLWGYINRDGMQVIEFQYKDARSFSNHLGAVKEIDEWEYVSENNAVVIEGPFYGARPFHNGIAQADTADGIILVTLKYFEN